MPGLDGSSQHPVKKQKGGFEEKEKGVQPNLNQEPEVEIESSADAPEPPKVEKDPPSLPPGVGTSKPLKTPKAETPKEKRVAGSCLFSNFVGLQLIAHTDEGKSCGKPVILYDNRLCNSPLSGKQFKFKKYSNFLNLETP